MRLGGMPQRTKREKELKSAGFNLQKNDKEANRRLAFELWATVP